MQERDVVLPHLVVNFSIGPLLFVGEHRQVGEMLPQIGKTVDFFFVDLKHAVFYGSGQHGLCDAGSVEQVLLAHLTRGFLPHPVREVEVGHEQGFLLRIALHGIEEPMQAFLIALPAQ